MVAVPATMWPRFARLRIRMSLLAAPDRARNPREFWVTLLEGWHTQHFGRSVQDTPAKV